MVDLQGLLQRQCSSLTGLNDGYGLPKLITHDGGGALGLGGRKEAEKLMNE